MYVLTFPCSANILRSLFILFCVEHYELRFYSCRSPKKPSDKDYEHVCYLKILTGREAFSLD